jgi:DNA-binding CsgD family transcriptional regulator
LRLCIDIGTTLSAAEPNDHGLTSRELAVLRLLAAGRTNAQIGAELYISPTTARVHISNILRKLGASYRVQAACAARAGRPAALWAELNALRGNLNTHRPRSGAIVRFAPRCPERMLDRGVHLQR